MCATFKLECDERRDLMTNLSDDLGRSLNEAEQWVGRGRAEDVEDDSEGTKRRRLSFCLLCKDTRGHLCVKGCVLCACRVPSGGGGGDVVVVAVVCSSNRGK